MNVFKGGLILGLVVLGLGSADISAQLSHGGSPAAWPVVDVYDSGAEVVEMPGIPKSATLNLGMEEKSASQPLRFAHPFFVSYSPDNSGSWQCNEDGSRTWHLAIRSLGAYSINLIFDRFVLHKGNSVFIYTPDQSAVLGALTYQNNNPEGILATAPIPGDEIIVELNIEVGAEEPELLIGAINHDYLNIFKVLEDDLKTSRMGYSSACHPEMSCEADELRLTNGQAVARLITDGTELCSGTLVNNTLLDGKPYFLTASHCLKGPNSHVASVFTFNYAVPHCQNNIEGAFLQTTSGSFIRARAADLDFVLLEMYEMPAPEYRPYWAGWSRTTAPEAPVYTIHHPQGDVKKISYSDNAPTNATFSYSGMVSNAHWLVGRWDRGATQGGSSGGGLFDASGRLIGGLSGGSATCANPVSDYFFRLNKAWNYYPEPEKQLAAWLAPVESNAMAIDGFDYYSETVKRYSNFTPSDEVGLFNLQGGSGYYSGHNSRGDRAFAEHFGFFSKATLHGFYILPASTAALQTYNVNIKVWGGTNAPEVVLWSMNNVDARALRINREYVVMLDSPLALNGNIWVGVELQYPSDGEDFALYQTAFRTEGPDNAWVRGADNIWRKLSDTGSGAGSASFMIDVLLSGVELIDTSDVIIDKGNFRISPNPARGTIDLYIYDLSGTARVDAFTLSGKLASSKNVMLNNGRGIMDISGLAPGVYIIRVEIEGKKYTGKLSVI